MRCADGLAGDCGRARGSRRRCGGGRGRWWSPRWPWRRARLRRPTPPPTSRCVTCAPRARSSTRAATAVSPSPAPGSAATVSRCMRRDAAPAATRSRCAGAHGRRVRRRRIGRATDRANGTRSNVRAANSRAQAAPRASPSPRTNVRIWGSHRSNICPTLPAAASPMDTPIASSVPAPIAPATTTTGPLAPCLLIAHTK